MKIARLIAVVLSLMIVFTPLAVSGQDNRPCRGFNSQLSLGNQARVLPGDPNNVRTSPATNAHRVGQIPTGATMSVIDGPVCVNGYTWWYVTLLEHYWMDSRRLIERTLAGACFNHFRSVRGRRPKRQQQYRPYKRWPMVLAGVADRNCAIIRSQEQGARSSPTQETLAIQNTRRFQKEDLWSCKTARPLPFPTCSNHLNRPRVYLPIAARLFAYSGLLHERLSFRQRVSGRRQMHRWLTTEHSPISMLYPFKPIPSPDSGR